MRLQRWGLALLLGVVVSTIAAPTMAQAQRYDRYRDYRSDRYYRGRDRDEIRQREILRSRLFDLADRVRLAEREGYIGRRKSDRLFEDLDDVRDFLRDDRHLSDNEFRRRLDDLRDVEEELRESRGNRRYYDDWYRDRFRRPYRRDRYYDSRYRDRDDYYRR